MLPMLPLERRQALAVRAGVREQYVYQVLRGLGMPSPTLARRLNRLEPALRLQDLRPDDWREIWPDIEEVEHLRAQVAQLLARLRTYEPDAAPALTLQAPAAINSAVPEVV